MYVAGNRESNDCAAGERSEGGGAVEGKRYDEAARARVLAMDDEGEGRKCGDIEGVRPDERDSDG